MHCDVFGRVTILLTSYQPIFHTASDKNLGIGKAGYEANYVHCDVFSKLCAFMYAPYFMFLCRLWRLFTVCSNIEVTSNHICLSCF